MARKKKLSRKEIITQSAIYAIKKTYNAFKYMVVAHSTVIAGVAMIKADDIKAMYEFIRDIFVSAGINLPVAKMGVYVLAEFVLNLLYVFVIKFVQKYKELSK